MIDPKELMIDNYVMVGDDVMSVRGVEATTDTYIHVISTDAWAGEDYPSTQEVQPISLSAQVLGACGFNKWSRDGQIAWHIDAFAQGREVARHDIDLISGNIYLKSRYDTECLTYQRMPHIKHLHQMQNLYFSLTGQPLEIDLQKLKNALQ